MNRQRPHLGNAGRAGYNNMEYRPNVLGYFEELAGRLRDVRVCCGDWSRVCTSGAMSYGSKVGVFLDPRTSATSALQTCTRSTTTRFPTPFETGAWSTATT